MRRSGSPLNTSELFLMLPSAKHLGRAKVQQAPPIFQRTFGRADTPRHSPPLRSSPVALCKQASQSVALQRNTLPSIRQGSAPSSPTAAHAPPSPGTSDSAASPPGPRKQTSPSPKRSAGYLRPAKKKIEWELMAGAWRASFLPVSLTALQVRAGSGGHGRHAQPHKVIVSRLVLWKQLRRACVACSARDNYIS